MDEKGKLFGKLNIVDLLVILLVIAAAVFLVLRQGKDTDSGGGESATLTYQVLVKGVDPRSYESVQQFVNLEEGKKDQLLAGSTPANAYAVDCVASPHMEYLNTEDGQIKQVQSDEDNRLDLLFTVEAQVDDLVTNTVGAQQVRVGFSHVMKTIHMEFSGGTIVSASWEMN